jgi:hypothetical protein
MMKRIARMLLGMVFVPLGCTMEVVTDDSVDGTGDQPLGKVAQEFAYVSGQVWPKHDVSVCFINGAGSTEAEWVRTAVRDRWSAVANINFTGWGACQQIPRRGGWRYDADIKISVSDSYRSSSKIGASAALYTTSPTMKLSFFQGTPQDVTGDGQVDFSWCFNDDPIRGDVPGIDWPSARMECITSVAVHEFGHALGVVHEDERPGSQCGGQDGTDYDATFGARDPVSIMNYCSPIWDNDSFLSPFDIAGAQHLYGRGADNDFVWYSFGNVVDFTSSAVDALLFDTKPRTVSGSYSRPFTGDFNGDGRSDVFWYQPGSGADLLWRARSGQRFAEMSGFDIDGTYTPIVGNFDGDGYDDIYWYGEGTRADFLWFGTSDMAFSEPGSPKRFDYSGRFVPLVGDFDNNGRSDIFWYKPGTGQDYIWWGSGAAGDFTEVTSEASGTYQPFTGDFDGDGYSDIYWYGPGTARDFTWWGRSGRSFTTNVDLDAYDEDARPVVGDFDGNGTTDIFWDVIDPDTNDWVWLNWPERWESGFSSRILDEYTGLTGDFNGDGTDDIFWYTPG